MNWCREDDSKYPFCYFHPKEVVIGVCAHCLNERLIVLASKQGHIRSSSSASSTYHEYGTSHVIHKKSPINYLPKVFAFSSIINRQHSKSDNSSSDHDASSSQEDSFISIKFEDNGIGSWEKNARVMTKVSLEKYTKTCNKNLDNKQTNKVDRKSETNTSIIERHSKSHVSMRWRKRIAYLFHLVKWKKTSNKGSNVCHVGTKVEGVKLRKGNWIRTLTKKRTKE